MKELIATELQRSFPVILMFLFLLGNSSGSVYNSLLSPQINLGVSAKSECAIFIGNPYRIFILKTI